MSLAVRVSKVIRIIFGLFLSTAEACPTSCDIDLTDSLFPTLYMTTGTETITIMPNSQTNGVILFWTSCSFSRSIHEKNTDQVKANDSVANFIRELKAELRKNFLPTQMIIPVDNMIQINNSRFSVLKGFPILWQNHPVVHKNSHIDTAINAAIMLQKIDIRAMLGMKSENDA